MEPVTSPQVIDVKPGGTQTEANNIIGLCRVHFTNVKQIMLCVDTIEKQLVKSPVYFMISHSRLHTKICEQLKAKITNKYLVCMLYESETIPSPMVLLKIMYEQADKDYPNAWYFCSHGHDLWHPARTHVYANCLKSPEKLNSIVIFPVHVEKIPGCPETITDVEKALDEQKVQVAIPEAMASIEHYMVYGGVLHEWFQVAGDYLSESFSDWIFQRYFCLGSTRITTVDLTVENAIPLWMFYGYSERAKLELPAEIWDSKEVQQVLIKQMHGTLIIPPKRVLTELYNRMMIIACFSIEFEHSKIKQVCSEAVPGDLYIVYKKIIKSMTTYPSIVKLLKAPIHTEVHPFPHLGTSVKP